MYFRDPKKELPENYKTVFVRTGCDSAFSYYFAYYNSNSGRWYPSEDIEFVYSINNVIGWLPLSELDSIEIK